MSPHNAGRHALVPAAGDMQILWMDAKARNLSQALRGLDQDATALVADAVAMAMDRKRAQGAWSRKSWAVVNATASLAVREAFGASEGIRLRVLEASLFAGGRVGAVTVEGPGRNPSTTDLMAEFYAMLQEERELSSIVFNEGEAMARQGTGHGCGSLTMVMSDGRLSLFAAGMAEYLLGRQENGLPVEGERSSSGGSRMTAWVWRGERSRFRPSPPWRQRTVRPGRFICTSGHCPRCRRRPGAGRMRRLGACSWAVYPRSRELPMSWTCWTRRRTANARPTNSSSVRRACEDAWRTTRRPLAGRSTALEHGTATCLPGAHRPQIRRRRERCRWRAWHRRYS